MKLQAMVLIVAAMSAGAPPATHAETSRLRITSPEQGAAIGARVDVGGTAESGVKQVWVVVHALDTDLCWTQGPTQVGRDNAWRLVGQAGAPGTGSSRGRYVIRALATPNFAIEPGPSTCGPAAKIYSDAVYVTRK